MTKEKDRNSLIFWTKEHDIGSYRVRRDVDDGQKSVVWKWTRVIPSNFVVGHVLDFIGPGVTLWFVRVVFSIEGNDSSWR